MQYYRYEPFLNTTSSIIDFLDDSHSASFKFKQKTTFQIGNDRTKYVEKIVPLKHLSNFWRTLEMSSINYKITLILTWSENCFIIANATDGQVPTFATTDTKLYVTVEHLLTQDNVKLSDQLKSGFKRKTNWNKYQSKVIIQAQNQYSNY